MITQEMGMKKLRTNGQGKQAEKNMKMYKKGLVGKKIQVSRKKITQMGDKISFKRAGKTHANRWETWEEKIV